MNTRRFRSYPSAAAFGGSGVKLARDEERLLRALAGEGVFCFPDPTEPGSLIVRSEESGISLGHGRFSAVAAEALLAAGLAEREPARRTRIVMSQAGRARLRRVAAAGETGFLAQHLELVEAPDEPAAMLDASESPLSWMARRRGRDGVPLIDAACFEAGERLRRDITLAAMLPRMAPDWGVPRVDGSGPRDPASGSDTMLAARSRVETALAAVGSDLAGLLIDLCGFLKGLERIEAERSWPARSAKVVARIALGRLAEHYGLQREAVGPDRGRLRLWRDGAAAAPPA